MEREGSVNTGDAFELLSQESRAITIAEMNHLFADDRYNRGLLDKAIATPALPEDLRDYLKKRRSASVEQ